MFSSNSFNINQEIINTHLVLNKVPESTPIFTPKLEEEKPSVYNISLSKSGLDSSLSNLDILNTVKKAMELNINYVNSYKLGINLNQPKIKSSTISLKKMSPHRFYWKVQSKTTHKSILII